MRLRVARVTAAHRAKWRSWTQEQAQAAFLHGQAAIASGDDDGARRWFERSRRISGGAPQVEFALAMSRLLTGDAAGAADLLNRLLRRYDFREGGTALATALHRVGAQRDAARALSRALSRHAPAGWLLAGMDAIARDAGWPGWCGLDGSGRLLADGADAFAQGPVVEVLVDGAPVARLPPDWRSARRIEVRRRGVALLGSPLDIGSILRCEGFVECLDGGRLLQGWLWHPGEAERAPLLTIEAADGTLIRHRLEAVAEAIESEAPLTRPRALSIPFSALPEGTVRLFGDDGRELTGSPITPALRRSWRPGLVRQTRIPVRQIEGPARQPASRPPAPGPDVVIPVHGGLDCTLACIASVRASRRSDAGRIVVVDDAGPEPALARALDVLAAEGAIVLIRLPRTLGYPGAANAGIAACARRDVMLLNSDTLVPPGAIEALRTAAYSAPDIGSVTPLSNDASIFSYPDRGGGNPLPDQAGVAALMALAAAANGGEVIDVPTGHGYCLYLRRDCLQDSARGGGVFRTDLFAQGYAEENEFCLRSAARGWRHVAATGIYVGHVGQASFEVAVGAARTALMRRNLATLNRLHPGYDALVEAHIAADPLARSRRRIDRRRFVAGRGSPPAGVLLITHDETGGVSRIVAERAASIARRGLRPVVLRPVGGGCLVDVPQADAPDRHATPNLVFRLPQEIDLLVELLAGEGLVHAEWHHFLGHHPVLRTLCDRLGLPFDMVIHDYASFCARIALVGPTGRYCGEPDLAGCDACIALQGSLLGEAIAPADLYERSLAEFVRARRVVAPSIDACVRIARHFTAVRPELLAWEADRPAVSLQDFADRAPPRLRLHRGAVPRARICLIGGIGREKGYDVLLACLGDRNRRDLELDFILVGSTRDDAALLEAGCSEVTGAYREAEAVALVREQRCDLAWLPSIWPETWCFTLTLAWRAGLNAVCFDIGAQAERVRATGRGTVLPLALPAPAINDALLRLCASPAMIDLQEAGWRG
ncbi:glycosyltransferase [Lichenicoccus roseus]|uniref:Glycosyltransferase n=1 Tax=Lichenicoccus roseus TaxID=2683649 RepID=A0A5R9J734_9PROT|nr:glycosyltransferase [Lichenicoccus roseus]TLU73382.1 glycosyltransferase [Lichenicoccus roseus]